ncbi:MAG: L,D-transpeptidase family protein [Paracoccaceae bacterium]
MISAALCGGGVRADEPLPYIRSVAEAASGDQALAAFYAARNYRTLWTGAEDAARREALFAALATAPDHALPVARYDAAGLAAAFRAAVTEGDRGRLEVAMSRAFLAFAHDVQGGVLEPKKIDAGLVREIPRKDPVWLLAGVAGGDPQAFLQALLPRSPEYSRLMREKIELEGVIRSGGWGPAVQAGLRPGAKGEAVVALRDRLAAMGYLGRSVTQTFDAPMKLAVQRFQSDHGLAATGAMDQATAEEINTGPEARLASVIVAMERLRWMGDQPLGDRHIWVNLPDFTAKIVDQGQVVFQTRAVIGKNTPDQRTPEFSDQMEFMVINPSWSVPRSITTKEYLPLLQRNPNAVSHLQVVDSRGRVVPRGAVNFAAYSARNFPYALRQPPSDGNALGKVKFMFPNKYNIYLHDTPSKSLFDNDTRAYSHGCIRLGQPFDFAYALLARQTDDPQGEFESHLRTKSENRLNLAQPVPVHLVYFTAWPTAKGQMTWRKDVYGRDAAIFEALRDAGVVPGGVQG